MCVEDCKLFLPFAVYYNMKNVVAIKVLIFVWTSSQLIVCSDLTLWCLFSVRLTAGTIFISSLWMYVCCWTLHVASRPLSFPSNMGRMETHTWRWCSCCWVILVWMWISLIWWGAQRLHQLLTLLAMFTSIPGWPNSNNSCITSRWRLTASTIVISSLWMYVCCWALHVTFSPPFLPL
jgi:hypothetical protein